MSRSMCACPLAWLWVSGPSLRVQDPKRQAAIMAAKFLGAHVAVVMPSRLEASFSCFDHFLGRMTASGEPLGHDGQVGTLPDSWLPTICPFHMWRGN